jgi:hypothetical protein
MEIGGHTKGKWKVKGYDLCNIRGIRSTEISASWEGDILFSEMGGISWEGDMLYIFRSGGEGVYRFRTKK